MLWNEQFRRVETLKLKKELWEGGTMPGIFVSSWRGGQLQAYCFTHKSGLVWHEKVILCVYTVSCLTPIFF